MNELKEYKIFSILGFPFVVVKTADEEEEIKAISRFKLRECKINLIEDPEETKFERWALDSNDKDERIVITILKLFAIIILLCFKHVIIRMVLLRRMSLIEVEDCYNFTTKRIERIRLKRIKQFSGI